MFVYRRYGTPSNNCEHALCNNSEVCGLFYICLEVSTGKPTAVVNAAAALVRGMFSPISTAVGF
jgi:hypothetical protein